MTEAVATFPIFHSPILVGKNVLVPPGATMSALRPFAFTRRSAVDVHFGRAVSLGLGRIAPFLIPAH